MTAAKVLGQPDETRAVISREAVCRRKEGLVGAGLPIAKCGERERMPAEESAK